MIKLDYWPRRWQSAVLNPETRKISLKWMPSKAEKLNGWAYKYDGKWCALYSENGRVTLQFGDARWNVDDHLSAKNELEGHLRKLSILCDGEEKFSLSYKAIDNKDDPTFDVMDLETEDFFYWAHKLINEQKYLRDLIVHN